MCVHIPFLELASSSKGGKVLETSDELFGEGLHLIKDGPAIEDKDRETANGFWKVISDTVDGYLPMPRNLFPKKTNVMSGRSLTLLSP
jgi:hypothetical protein